MLRGLTRAGLGVVGSDERFVELAAAGGFQAVDIDAKGMIERVGEAGEIEKLAQNGIDEPNVDLLLDAYHWYTNSLEAADIERLQAHQIVHVHINDAPNVPVKAVLDNDRLYPGEGVIDLAGFLCGLQRIGYDGIVAQEILAPSMPKDTPEQLIRRSKAGFDRVFAAAGQALAGRWAG